MGLVSSGSWRSESGQEQADVEPDTRKERWEKQKFTLAMRNGGRVHGKRLKSSCLPFACPRCYLLHNHDARGYRAERAQ
jgi:hypothetical protein